MDSDDALREHLGGGYEMTDEEIVERLRAAAVAASPVEVAAALEHMLSGGLTQGAIITYFVRAFPQIPLRTLLEAAGWHRVAGGSLSDADFDALLRPWLPVSFAT